MIYEIGIVDVERCSHLKSYKVWYRILARCYGKLKTWKRYHDCEICEEWKHYSNFKKWYDLNYRHDLERKGIKLDLTKSAFEKYCKVFGPKTCAFLPRRVVLYLSKQRKTNTTGITGIHKAKDKYIPQINEFGKGKTIRLGVFDTLEEARVVYERAKEDQTNKMLEYLRELNYPEDIITKIEKRAKGSGLMKEEIETKILDYICRMESEIKKLKERINKLESFLEKEYEIPDKTDEKRRYQLRLQAHYMKKRTRILSERLIEEYSKLEK